MWHIDTLEYYSVVKKNGILNFACKWMELENTILSEVTQTQKDVYGMHSPISGYYLQTKDIEPIVHDPREAK